MADWKGIGKTVAKFAPMLGKLIPIPGASLAIDLVAGALNCEPEPKAIQAAIKADPQAAAKLAQVEMDNEHELKMAWLKNTDSAREMYKTTSHKTADDLAERIMKMNLPIIFALVCLNLLVVIFIPKDKVELVAIVSNFIGITIGQLFNERQAVVNFFFGSSKGSKDKDKV